MPDLKGISPDEAFSSLPYEKGFTFLFYLEELLGGPAVFEPFLKAYIHKFEYKSIITDDFKAFLLEYFAKTKHEELQKINWDLWLFSEGMPPVVPKYDDSLQRQSLVLTQTWLNATDEGASIDDKEYRNLTSGQQISFFTSLIDHESAKPGTISSTKLSNLIKTYGLHSVKNAEVRFSWLRLALIMHYEDAIEDSLKFVVEQGRMKFIIPIYR